MGLGLCLKILNSIASAQYFSIYPEVFYLSCLPGVANLFTVDVI
jgi:hypothetical protein